MGKRQVSVGRASRENEHRVPQRRSLELTPIGGREVALSHAAGLRNGAANCEVAGVIDVWCVPWT